MLHNAGDQDVAAVGDDVHLELDTGHVFIDEDRVLDTPGEDDGHVAAHFVLAVGDGHVLPADDVRGPQKHRISQRLRRADGFVHRHDAEPLRTADAVALQQLVETVAVLCQVDAVGGRAEDTDAVSLKKRTSRMAVWPPKATTTPMGSSTRITFITSSGERGSK